MESFNTTLVYTTCGHSLCEHSDGKRAASIVAGT